MVFGSGGGKGGNIKGIQNLWVHPQYGLIFQVPWESIIGNGWWLAGSDPESDEGAGGLEENYEDPEQGGGEAAGVRIFIQSLRLVGVDFWCGDVGGYPPHGTGTGGFPNLE